MDSVIVVQFGGEVSKVCESWEAFDKWFYEYGKYTYDRDELDVVEAKVREE